MTLNGVIALILRYFTKFDKFAGRLRHIIIPLQLWHPNSPDLNPDDAACAYGDYCKRWTKYASLIWRTKTATENGVGQAGLSLRQPLVSGVVRPIGPDQWCLFCTPSLAIFSTCCYHWIQIGEFRGHSWGGI